MLESTRRVDTIVLDKTGTVTTGRMALVDVVDRRRHDGRRGAAPGRVARGRQRAPHRPGHRRRRPRRGASSSSAVESFASTPGARRRRASSTATPSSPAGSGSSPTGRCACPTTLRAAKDAAEADGPHARPRRLGRRRPRPCSSWPTPSRPPRPRPSPSCAALGLRPVLLTGDNERAARAVAAEVGIDEVDRRGPPRRTRSTSSAASRTTGGSWPWSATA